MVRKDENIKLRNYYNIILEGGLIVTLLLLLFAFKANFASDQGDVQLVKEQETVKMEEVIQTKQVKTPPPPPRPPVPVEVPNDEVVEDEILNLNADLNMDDKLDVPPPPPEEEEEDEEKVFVVVEKQPELKGGIGGLQKKIEYPEMARKAGIEGRVIIQFVVNEQGQVVNPRVVRGIGGGCDKEALRVVKTAQFTPGMQRGRPVKVQYTLPITFQLRN